MERSKFVLLLSGVAVLVAALVFLKWALISRQIPRDGFQDKQLKVLAYSTFLSSTGPAPELVRRFKKSCQCEVEFQNAGDAGLLLERLKLTQNKSHFDLVIGLDQFYAGKALKEWKWKEAGLSAENSARIEDFVKNPDSEKMVPFDYAPMTFIYRSKEVAHPPRSLEELLEPRFRSALSLQDPRSSSPGLQFLSWVERQKGAEAENYLKKLKPNIHSVSPSWALSYGLFKKEQSRFVFSYVTSLAYHLAVEKDDSFSAVSFDEGHPLQVEYAAIPEGCNQCELATRFLNFLAGEEAQGIIAAKNFMYPVLKNFKGPAVFERLPALKTLPLETKMPRMETWDRALE